MEQILLYIGGFVIKVIFHPSEVPYFKNRLKREIFSFYKNFILDFKPIIEADYIIHLYDQAHEIFSMKKQRNSHKKFIQTFSVKAKEKEIITYYHLSLSQFIHLMAFTVLGILIENGGFMLHGSASLMNKKAIIFTGESGAGKSTATQLLRSRYQTIADDRLFIRSENRSFYLYCAPFVAKYAGLRNDSKKYLLDKIFFLKKTKFFKIERLTDKSRIFQMMIKQIVADRDALERSIKNLRNFINTFNEFYTLSFKKEKKQMLQFFHSL